MTQLDMRHACRGHIGLQGCLNHTYCCAGMGALCSDLFQKCHCCAPMSSGCRYCTCAHLILVARFAASIMQLLPVADALC